MRMNYWSHSKFAKKFRGYQKPSALTLDEWREWRTNIKSKFPIRYWFFEEFLNKLQNFIYKPLDKYYNVKWYLVNRFINKTHCLVASPENIKPGTYMEYGDRILPCLFDELTNFVEENLAMINFAFFEKQGLKYTGRNKEAGIDYLHWEMSLIIDESMGYNKDHVDYGKPSSQSTKAKIIYDLYMWYNDTYKNRKSAYDLSGYTEFFEAKIAANKNDFFKPFNDPRFNITEIMKKCDEIEKQYYDEETKMLQKLVEIRSSLWS